MLRRERAIVRTAQTDSFLNANRPPQAAFCYTSIMDEAWQILLYTAPQGGSPVKEFINSLELKAQAKIRNTIHLLQDFGIRLGPPHIKKLTGTQLWELRILGADSIRVLYIAISGKTFLLLHGFMKKRNKTTKKEIHIAEERLAEHRSRRIN